jgi:hypothetical protein
VLISRGDAIVAIAMSIEAGQYVISIPPAIAVSVMESLTELNPTHYLDKGAPEIMVADGENAITAVGAMGMYQSIFGEQNIASVAVLPPGTPPERVKAAISRGSIAPVEQVPSLILLSQPDAADPEITYVVDLMIEALAASEPEHAAYLKEAAKAYEEKYGDE